VGGKEASNLGRAGKGEGRVRTRKGEGRGVQKKRRIFPTGKKEGTVKKKGSRVSSSGAVSTGGGEESFFGR